MEPPIFIVSPEQLSQEQFEISGPEAHHALNALRLRVASMIVVIDGMGNACTGEIVSVRDRKMTVRVHSRVRNFGEPIIHLTLAAALSSSSKFTEIVEKGTELGVGRFVPLLSSKSKVRVDDLQKAQSKVARLEKVALAAVKQSRRSCLPVVASPMTLEQYLVETEPEGTRLIFSPEPRALPLSRMKFDGNVCRVAIMVGAEAGFSGEEVDLAISYGFVPVSMGKRILRAENAAPVACALVMHLLGELI